jgi:hypothetical protein
LIQRGFGTRTRATFARDSDFWRAAVDHSEHVVTATSIRPHEAVFELNSQLGFSSKPAKRRRLSWKEHRALAATLRPVYQYMLSFAR